MLFSPEELYWIVGCTYFYHYTLAYLTAGVGKQNIYGEWAAAAGAAASALFVAIWAIFAQLKLYTALDLDIHCLSFRKLSFT